MKTERQTIIRLDTLFIILLIGLFYFYVASDINPIIFVPAYCGALRGSVRLSATHPNLLQQLVYLIRPSGEGMADYSKAITPNPF
jgi:hypothetical protein